MISRLLVIGAVLGLTACAIWPSGNDSKGQELKTQATPVLIALVKYHADRGAYPSSLYELVPKYLAEIPFAANLNLVTERKLIEFDYSPSWPQPGAVTCVAQLGQVEWSCSNHV